jgi:cytochrome P450
MGEPAQLFRCQAAVLELTEYLRGVIARHRSEGRGGIIGVLLDAKDQGLLQSDDEIFGNIIMFLVVGYHTTANLLCNGLQLFFEHPDQRERLTQNFDLLPTAIDEIMRFHGPVASVRRMARVDMSIRGRPIAAGQTMLVVLAAANRDPAVYEDPDRFDIGRKDNRHVGFTVGPYACMGKALAVIEAATFFRTMLTRFPTLRPRDEQPNWVAFRPLGHELKTMHVRVD